MYDVLNVLSALGIINKTHKAISWIRPHIDVDAEDRLARELLVANQRRQDAHHMMETRLLQVCGTPLVVISNSIHGPCCGAGREEGER